MNEQEVRLMAGAAKDVMPIRSGYRISRVEIEEALPGNWVVLAYFEGHADPCVMGDEAGTQGWLDAHRKKPTREIGATDLGLTQTDIDRILRGETDET